jgi:hypothetical protein
VIAVVVFLSILPPIIGLLRSRKASSNTRGTVALSRKAK